MWPIRSWGGGGKYIVMDLSTIRTYNKHNESLMSAQSESVSDQNADFLCYIEEIRIFQQNFIYHAIFNQINLVRTVVCY